MAGKLPKDISAIVDGVASRVVGNDWALYAALFRRWREIIGEEYADATSPVKLSAMPRGTLASGEAGCRPPKRLHIALPRGLVTDITFAKPRILERIADCIGREVIADLVLEPRHTTKSKAFRGRAAPTAPPVEWRERIDREIENPDLRAALESLGAWMKG